MVSRERDDEDPIAIGCNATKMTSEFKLITKKSLKEKKIK